MAKNNGRITAARILVEDGRWVPIVTPMDCNAYAFYNSGKLRLRTDSEDENTETVFEAGANPSLFLPQGQGRVRFARGETIIFARCYSGSDTLRCVFVL